MQTLSIAIYSMTRRRVSPQINALSAIMFVVILGMLLVMNFHDIRADRHKAKEVRL